MRLSYMRVECAPPCTVRDVTSGVCEPVRPIVCIDGVSSVSEAPRPPEAGALLGAATENVSQMIEVTCTHES